MKALFIVTGRGLGGDAMVALNTMRALERRGVQCEIALDASGHYLKKTDIPGIGFQFPMREAIQQQNCQPPKTL